MLIVFITDRSIVFSSKLTIYLLQEEVLAEKTCINLLNVLIEKSSINYGLY